MYFQRGYLPTLQLQEPEEEDPEAEQLLDLVLDYAKAPESSCKAAGKTDCSPTNLEKGEEFHKMEK